MFSLGFFMFLDGEDSPVAVLQLLQKIIHLVVSVHLTAGVKCVSRLHLILHLSVVLRNSSLVTRQMKRFGLKPQSGCVYSVRLRGS